MLVTSATGAFARGQMAFGHTMLLCTEGELATITLDARGNPVRTAHSCPDCLAATSGLPPATLEITHPFGRWLRLAVPSGATLTPQSTPHAFARGPPVLI